MAWRGYRSMNERHRVAGAHALAALLSRVARTLRTLFSNEKQVWKQTHDTSVLHACLCFLGVGPAFFFFFANFAGHVCVRWRRRHADGFFKKCGNARHRAVRAVLQVLFGEHPRWKVCPTPTPNDVFVLYQFFSRVLRWR